MSVDKLDNEWAKRAFLVPGALFEDKVDSVNRHWSSASAKFTDSRLGGNIGINSRYQFTRYSDIRSNGRLAGRNEVKIESATGNHGLGRYMSEVYDDNTRCVYLQFGVPKFNGLVNFLARATDYQSIMMVKSGRAPGFFFNAAKYATMAVGLVLVSPVITIPMLAIKTASFTSEMLFGRPNAKFYTLKPTMTHYWSTVNTLVQIMSVNKGLIPAVFRGTPIDPKESRKLNQPVQIENSFLTDMSAMYPELFNGMGMIDVYSVANRAQRLANRVFVQEYDATNKLTPTDFTGYLKDDTYGSGTRGNAALNPDGSRGIGAALNRMMKVPELWGVPTSHKGNTMTYDSVELDENVGDPDDKVEVGEKRSVFGKYFEELNALYSDGAEFAIFRVEETGSVSDSFSNSVAENDLSQKINSMANAGRKARYTFADGNILSLAGTVIGDTVGAAVETVANAAKDVVAGALDTVTMGLSNIPLILSGLGYVDIPKNWESSSMNLARLTYTMDLISPYNNALSQLQDIYIPLAMIMAGALPRSTGEMSHGAPFICQLYDRGRVQIKTGIIESLSIERGITTLPFSKRGEALGIRVSFSVLDLSTIMHVPVSSGGVLGSNSVIGENSMLADYLAVLAGMDIASQLYPMSKARLNLMRRVAESSKFTSPAFYAMHTRDISKTFIVGSVIEALSRGSELTYGGMGKS